MSSFLIRSLLRILIATLIPVMTWVATSVINRTTASYASPYQRIPFPAYLLADTNQRVHNPTASSVSGLLHTVAAERKGITSAEMTTKSVVFSEKRFRPNIVCTYVVIVASGCFAVTISRILGPCQRVAGGNTE